MFTVFFESYIFMNVWFNKKKWAQFSGSYSCTEHGKPLINGFSPLNMKYMQYEK